MSAKTLGAHFLSQDALCTTWKTETLDACIARIDSLRLADAWSPGKD